MMNFGNEDLIIKSGWLTKLGGNAIRKTWKRRWFVLKGNNLYYYRDQNVKEASGVINLSLYNSVTQDTTITKKSQYCIRIEKVIKESDSIHSNLSTYHDIATISSSSSSTSSTVSTPVSIISSSKSSSKISKLTNNSCSSSSSSNIVSSSTSPISTSTTITLKKPSIFVVFADNENGMQEWMTLLEKRLGDRNIVDIVLDRLDLANIGMHKRQGSYSSLRSFYSKNSSFCSSSGSTTTNSNLSSRRPSLDSLSLDTPPLDSRKSSMDSFRSNQNTISHNTIINNNNSDNFPYQSISRPETPSNLVALFGIGQPILRKPASHGCLQDKHIINSINNNSANNSNIDNTIIGEKEKPHTRNQSLTFFKDFNTNTTPSSSSPLSSSTTNATISANNNITSSNRQQCTPLIMVHGENSKIVTPSSPDIYFLGNDDNNIDLNDDEDSLITPLANVFPSHLTDKFN